MMRRIILKKGKMYSSKKMPNLLALIFIFTLAFSFTVYAKEKDPGSCLKPVAVYGHAAADEKSDIVYYIVKPEEQMSPLTSVQVTFVRDEPHMVWVDLINGEQMVLGSFGAGTHMISLPDNITLLEMIIHDDEVASLDMKIPEATVNLSLYTGKYISVLGDSFSSSSMEENVQDDVEGYNITAKWWYITAKELGMNILVDGTAGSIGIGIDAPQDAKNSGLHKCTQLHTKDHVPDYVFVLLGMNDVFAGKRVEEIEKEYRQMVEQTKTAYPQANIILFTYPYIGDVAGGTNQALEKLVAQMNGVILNIAGEYNLNAVDLHACGITAQNIGSYIRSANDFHYNRAGQALIGQQAINGLLEAAGNN